MQVRTCTRIRGVVYAVHVTVQCPGPRKVDAVAAFAARLAQDVTEGRHSSGVRCLCLPDQLLDPVVLHSPQAGRNAIVVLHQHQRELVQ